MEIDKTIVLSNGVEMPRFIQGVPHCDQWTNYSVDFFYDILRTSVRNGIVAFDSSHAYGKSESTIGYVLRRFAAEGISRKEVFITSKIDNHQQYVGNMNKCVDDSLKTMKTDYLDCMLFHWPVQNHFEENWLQLEDAYKKGKVRSIGIANAKIFHIERLRMYGATIVPHVIQTEIHPFNSCLQLRDYSEKHKIALQACSSLANMIDKMKYNKTLIDLSRKYSVSLVLLVLRWHLQSNIAPLFRSFNPKHIEEIKRVFTFNISNEDMRLIDALNENYRYHPESSNCAGF